MLNVYCIVCGGRLLGVKHLMFCLKLEGFPVFVQSPPGCLKVSHGWASQLDGEHVEVCDIDTGVMSLWPVDWIYPVMEAS